MPVMAVSGNELKVERVRAHVTIIDLAARMGLSRQTLWGIERAARVSPERAVQYRAALLTFDDVTEATA
jgi:transcriptional regulator with XRE-family HTH domain